jgi:hypothetical protein
MATIKKAAKGTCAPKASNVSSRLGSYGKKMKTGGSLGMNSVKDGFDKNPGVTRADIIVAGKGQAKKGMKVKKQAATAIAMKQAGKAPKAMMKTGGKVGKCKYGCK